MGTFVPNTKAQQQEMLKEIGYEKLDDLFAHIPDAVKFKGELDLPSGLSEMEAAKEIKKIAAKNRIYDSVFRGAGAYRHYVPAIVGSVTGNETLQTAYTPYQAEISQGVLQSIFEYQTMICDLTGMDVSNASVYDGGTAAGEAVAMCRGRKANRALVSACIQPSVMKVIETYCFGNEMELVVIPEKDHQTDVEALKELMTDDTACVLIQHPNYYGSLEEAAEIGHGGDRNRSCAAAAFAVCGTLGGAPLYLGHARDGVLTHSGTGTNRVNFLKLTRLVPVPEWVSRRRCTGLLHR